MFAALGRPLMVPDLAPAARIDRPGVVGHREIENPVHLKRGGGNTPAKAAARLSLDAVHPCQRQRVDVRLVNLRQRRVPAPGVVAVIGRPVVRGRRAEFGRVQSTLSENRSRGEKNDSEGLHFRVSKYATMSCMFLSVYLSSSSWCACSGSFFTTFTAAVRL